LWVGEEPGLSDASITTIRTIRTILARCSPWDVDGNLLWAHQQRVQITSSDMSTAGNLAFVGDLDRYFRAFDALSGEILWQRRLSTVVSGFPISYSVDGRQYIAVITGWRGGDMLTSIPRQLTPEVVWPRAGNAVFVFALPEE
jgi:alcohol dehydrogenase (cytochrome c)